jgi:microcystin-dependent protein
MPDSRNRRILTGDVAFFLNEGAGVWRLGAHMLTEGSYTGRQGADIAASATLAVPSDGDLLNISGTTAVSAIAAAAAGYRFRARFTGTGLNLIYGLTTLQCPFETDYRTSLNEIVEFISLSAGNWLVVPQVGAPQLQPGTPFPWWGTTAPKGAVLCDATALNATTYYGLSKVLIPNAATLGNVGTSVGTFTADAGTDVLTCTAHGLAVNDIVHATTSAADLPLNMVINTVYFVKTVPTADTLTLSATRGGATFDIGDAGTGTHTLHNKVNAPDLRGRVWVGIDGAANRITSASTNGANADTLGGVGGTETHTLSNAEAPTLAHTHNIDDSPGSDINVYTPGGGVISTRITGVIFTDGTVDARLTTESTSPGSGNAHSNTPPWMAGGYVIRF